DKASDAVAPRARSRCPPFRTRYQTAGRTFEHFRDRQLIPDVLRVAVPKGSAGRVRDLHRRSREGLEKAGAAEAAPAAVLLEIRRQERCASHAPPQGLRRHRLRGRETLRPRRPGRGWLRPPGTSARRGGVTEPRGSPQVPTSERAAARPRAP